MRWFGYGVTGVRLFAGIGAAALTACTAVSGLDLNLSVRLSTDSPTVDVGDLVGFEFEATGSALIGVIVDYGDGTVDSVQAYGATSARGLVEHTFTESGAFVVRATAVDAVDGEATDDVALSVGL